MANDNLITLGSTGSAITLSASSSGGGPVTLDTTYFNQLKNSYGDDKYVTLDEFEALLKDAKYIVMSKKSGTSYVTEYILFTGSTIAANAYDGNTDIIQVILPENVNEIRQYAFRECTNLQYINLQNVTTLIINCFNGSGLSGNITIKYAYVIQGGAFRSTNITEFTVESCANALFDSNDTFRDCKQLKKVSLPNNVTSIPNYCFYGCTSLETFTLPTGITSVNAEAFRDCTSWKPTINLPNLTLLTGFYNCGVVGVENLGRITAPYGNQAFGNCKSLTYAKLPSTLTSMGNYLFQYCTALATVYVYATTPPSYGTAPFSGCNALTKIYVPSASVNAYKAATGWSAHASIIQAM